MSGSLQPSSLPSPTRAGLEQAVTLALSAAFEDMVFMEVSAAAGYAQSGRDVIWSRVATHAPVRAELLLQMTPGMVDACIDALYAGLDPSDALRQDVVRELLNTISGLVMSNLTDTETIDLGLPESGVSSPSTTTTVPELAQTHTTDLGGLAFTVHWR